MAIDSTIVKFETLGTNELSTKSNLFLFIILSTIFGVINFFLLMVLKNESIKYSYATISIFQYIIAGMLIFIILQMIILHNYSTLSLLYEIILIQMTALLFLGLLVKTLVNWIRSNKNRIIILYAISFSLLSLHILISSIYITYDLSFHTRYKIPMSIHMYLVTIALPDLANSFGPVLDILSFTSFVSAWVATSALLIQYRRRIGKMRFWTLMLIPMIYFLFPFETYFLDIVYKLSIEYPMIAQTSNILLFSATKQVGAILFATVFLTAASIVNRPRLKNSLVKTAIGIAILFSSMEVKSIAFAVYPPFGLLTILLMPLGACMILNGLVIAAGQISKDTELRKEFYSRAENQLNLLRTIGVTEMESQLMKSCKNLIGRFGSQEENQTYKELEDEDVKQIVREVLNELKSKKNRNADDTKINDE